MLPLYSGNMDYALQGVCKASGLRKAAFADNLNETRDEETVATARRCRTGPGCYNLKVRQFIRERSLATVHLADINTNRLLIRHANTLHASCKDWYTSSAEAHTVTELWSMEHVSNKRSRTSCLTTTSFAGNLDTGSCPERDAVIVGAHTLQNKTWLFLAASFKTHPSKKLAVACDLEEIRNHCFVMVHAYEALKEKHAKCCLCTRATWTMHYKECV